MSFSKQADLALSVFNVFVQVHATWLFVSSIICILFLLSTMKTTWHSEISNLNGDNAQVILTNQSWIYSFWFGWIYYLYKKMPFYALLSFITWNGFVFLFPLLNDWIISQAYYKKGYSLSYQVGWKGKEISKRIFHGFLIIIFSLVVGFLVAGFTLSNETEDMSEEISYVLSFLYIPVLATLIIRLLFDLFKGCNIKEPQQCPLNKPSQTSPTSNTSSSTSSHSYPS